MAIRHPYEEWIGRERVMQDTVTLDRARKLSATLDLDPDELREGAPLPLGFHWIYFHEPTRRSALAPDGHERRGSFLPPIPLARRMWAGGSLRFARDLSIGSTVRRVSTVRSVELKEGRSGSLAFVTIDHRLLDDDGVAVEERQDIVYLDPAPSEPDSGPKESGPKDAGARATGDGHGRNGPTRAPDWTRGVTFDETTLFRFSALTFNGHRIHFDRRYAVEIEHYPDIVVHGPLLALLLLGAGHRWASAQQDSAAEETVSFRYRAAQPVFCNEAVELCGAASPAADPGQAIELWAAEPVRGVVMTAELAIERS